MFTYWIHGGSDEWEYIFIVVPKDGLHPETQLFILCVHKIRPWPMRLKSYTLHTVKTLYRRFETNIPRNETARLPSQFSHSCFCERFIYFLWSVLSQIHECENWERGRTVSFLEMHKSDLLSRAAFENNGLVLTPWHHWRSTVAAGHPNREYGGGDKMYV